MPESVSLVMMCTIDQGFPIEVWSLHDVAYKDVVICSSQLPCNPTGGEILVTSTLTQWT